MKKCISLIAIVLVCMTLFVGCANDVKAGDSGANINKSSFVDISWTRETERDTETIRFGEDGSFNYSCACGNSVNDADLCEGYTYDSDTKTITLDYIEDTNEMISIIKIVKCNEKELHLDFNGDVRVFTK